MLKFDAKGPFEYERFRAGLREDTPGMLVQTLLNDDREHLEEMEGYYTNIYESIDWIEPFVSTFKQPIFADCDAPWENQADAISRAFQHCFLKPVSKQTIQATSRRALPIIICLLEHHSNEIKKRGIECCRHFLRTVPDIKKWGYHEAFFGLARNCLCFEGVAEEVFPLLTELIAFDPFQSKPYIAKWDSILVFLLNDLQGPTSKFHAV